MYDATTAQSHLWVNTDCHANELLDEIIQGLCLRQKTLPTKLFYDQHGSGIFEQICQLEEYYLTRTETALMRENIDEIVDLIGPQHTLLEFGSGSSIKTRILLDHLPGIRVYIPVDISREHLFRTAAQLRKTYPEVIVKPTPADYTNGFSLPYIHEGLTQILAYFPGSTIGNFHPAQAIEFLAKVAALAGPEGGLIIGVDLRKDADILHRAYNDSKGVTAAFNLNILSHINREFGSDFLLDRFEHCAFYNQDAGRIEMHLISRAAHTCSIAGHQFEFVKGETILTEVSYKFTLEGFAAIAAQAGFDVSEVWMDRDELFSVQYLVVKQDQGNDKFQG